MKFHRLSLPTAVGVALSGALATGPALAGTGSLEFLVTAMHSGVHFVPAADQRWVGAHRMRDALAAGAVGLAGMQTRWTWRPIPGDGWALVPMGWGTSRGAAAGFDAAGTEQSATQAEWPHSALPVRSTSGVLESAQANRSPQTGPAAGSGSVQSQSAPQVSGGTGEIYRVSPTGKIYLSTEPVQDPPAPGSNGGASDTYRVSPDGKIYLVRAGGDSSSPSSGLAGVYRVGPDGQIYFSPEPIPSDRFIGAEASSDSYRVAPGGQIYLVRAGGRISDGSGLDGVFRVSPSGQIYFSSAPVTRTSLAGAGATSDSYRVGPEGQIYLARADGSNDSADSGAGYYRVTVSGQIYFAPAPGGTMGTAGLDATSDSYRVDQSGAIYLARPPGASGTVSGTEGAASPQVPTRAAASTQVAMSDSYRVSPAGEIYLSAPQSAQAAGPQAEKPQPVAEPVMEPSPAPAPVQRSQSKPWWEFW